jgi:hypothetical protein
MQYEEERRTLDRTFSELRSQMAKAEERAQKAEDDLKNAIEVIGRKIKKFF